MHLRSAIRSGPRPRGANEGASLASFVIPLCVLASLISVPHPATAAVSAEQRCLEGLAKAAGKYQKCIQDQVAKLYKGAITFERFGRCVVKYNAQYESLRLKAIAAPGVQTCEAARFKDNMDETVSDNLTGLRWEKKTNGPGIHYKETEYSFSTLGSEDADGTVFTILLDTLNSTAFAGHSDWRLPTLAELLSITDPAYPFCQFAPCVPTVFGPTVNRNYWSSSAYLPDSADGWFVSFGNGQPNFGPKIFTRPTRAVRGGF